MFLLWGKQYLSSSFRDLLFIAILGTTHGIVYSVQQEHLGGRNVPAACFANFHLMVYETYCLLLVWVCMEPLIPCRFMLLLSRNIQEDEMFLLYILVLFSVLIQLLFSYVLQLSSAAGTSWLQEKMFLQHFLRVFVCFSAHISFVDISF